MKGMTTSKMIPQYAKGKMMKSKEEMSSKTQKKGYPKAKMPSKMDRLSMYR